MHQETTPVILGLPGPDITSETLASIKHIRPAGYILFERNCQNRKQLEHLIEALHAFSPFSPPLIFIDQEGGRVARVKWENFYVPPPGRCFGEIFERDPEKGVTAARLAAFVSAGQLAHLGITVNCVPVADVMRPQTHNVIGDRAFSANPQTVASLAGAMISGSLAGGVWPVIKHAPGHGRATADSHTELPVVEADLNALEEDFIPFHTNRACPFVMTAHIRYTALDVENPATQSTQIIQGVLRQKIGMEGLIISDDLCMKALQGPMIKRAKASLEAGCDLLLHCSGDLKEAAALAKLPPISESTVKKLEALPPLMCPEEETLADAREGLKALLS